MKNELPESFLRLRQIIGTREAPGPIPVSRSAWYAGMKAGKYPAPIRVGERLSLYRNQDILALIERLGAKAAA